MNPYALWMSACIWCAVFNPWLDLASTSTPKPHQEPNPKEQ